MTPKSPQFPPPRAAHLHALRPGASRPGEAPSIGFYSPSLSQYWEREGVGGWVRAHGAPTTASRHSGHSHLSPTDSRLPTPDSRLV